MDMVDKIMAYESGDLGGKETLELFAELIKNGQAWSLQGSYGRMASNLIDRDLLNEKGEINWELFEELTQGV